MPATPGPSLMWPDCFEAGALPDPLPYAGEDLIGWALATQLVAWGNCTMGAPIPPRFGEVMAALSHISGAALPDELYAASQQWKASRALLARIDNGD